MAEGEALSLIHTPTWIVAAICTAIVLISVLFERGLHYLGKHLEKKELMPLYEAVEKVKEELMLLGFIAVLLTLFKSVILKICVDESVMKHFLPCYAPTLTAMSARYGGTPFSRVLVGLKVSADEVTSAYCHKKGKVPALSLEAIDQLHMFIFLLGVTHVILTVITVSLGFAQMYKWRRWEAEAQDPPEQEQDRRGLMSIRQFTFIREHVIGHGKMERMLSWLQDFGKQFYAAVSKQDYLTMRRGFIVKNCPSLPKYNFYKYMERALIADFEEIAGINSYLWPIVIGFFLLNVHGWHISFWTSLIPLVLLLSVGTKLEHIITELAVKVAKKHTAIQGELVIMPSDSLFWFNSPRMVLILINIVVFQNAFQIAYFFWILFTFGYHSCVMETKGFAFSALGISVALQIVCSYSTLPLYAIVSHMGDSLSKEIFDKKVAKRITDWAKKARNTVEVSTSLSDEGFYIA